MKLLLLFLLFIMSSGTHAADCEEETTLRWILAESQNSDPRILLQRLNLNNVIAAEHEAGKIINPELEHFSVWGKEFEPGKVYMNESRLWFTLQLASKRNKRLDQWAQEKEMVTQETEMLKQSLMKDLWVNFFRTHQIYEEIQMKKAMIDRLEKILAKYRGRKFLSPDQTIEERIFTMVVNNFNLTLNKLEREKLGILQLFKEITAFKCDINKVAAESNKIKWPATEDLKILSESPSMRLKLAELNLSFAEAQKKVSESKKWTDLRIAPVVQNYKSDQMNNYMYGFSFTFPLPVLDRHQTERQKSFYAQKFAEKNVEITRLKEDHIFDYRLEKYAFGLKIVNEISVIDQSMSKLKVMTDGFNEGKLTISNIVEFCRQLDELMHNYHYGESVLMNDLLELYEQRGKIDIYTFEQLI